MVTIMKGNKLVRLYGQVKMADNDKSIKYTYFDRKTNKLIIKAKMNGATIFENKYEVEFIITRKKTEVFVFDPFVGTEELKSIKHIYRKDSSQGKLSICLYYNYGDRVEYDLSMPFFKTLWPWTLEWLYFYDYYKETGIWSGGGIKE